MQRKQSLWLFLSAITMLLCFFFPYGIENTTAMNTTAVATADLNAKSNWVLAILCGASSALALFTIFLFNNRSLQTKVCLLLIILCVGVGVYMFYDANLTLQGHKIVVGVLGSSLYIGLVVPLISASLAILALMGIRKDDKLIKSVDRLR